MSEYWERLGALVNKLDGLRNGKQVQLTGEEIRNAHLDMAMLLSERVHTEVLDVATMVLATGSLPTKIKILKSLYGWGKIIYRRHKEKLESEKKEVEEE